jgi:hypothetical protein
MVPTPEWLKQYESHQPQLRCKADLNRYFKDKRVIAESLEGEKVEVYLQVLPIGDVSLPSGEVIVCDPLVELGPDTMPYFTKVKPGEYPVDLALAMDSAGNGVADYAAARVRFTDTEPVCYENALIGNEDLSGEWAEGEYYGFIVDGGMACFCDPLARDAVMRVAGELKRTYGEDADIYNNLLSGLLEENYRQHPKYQTEYGDWLDWKVSGTNYHLPIFRSGYGDGFYPTFFGYDADGAVCCLIIDFLSFYSQ